MMKSVPVLDLKELVGAYVTGQLILLYPPENLQTHPNPSKTRYGYPHWFASRPTVNLVDLMIDQ